VLVRCRRRSPCKAGADEVTCLTGPQVDAVRKVYEGAKNPRTGEQLFTGWPRGSENFGDAAIMGWRHTSPT
jgi:feruloyl esterase